MKHYASGITACFDASGKCTAVVSGGLVECDHIMEVPPGTKPDEIRMDLTTMKVVSQAPISLLDPDRPPDVDLSAKIAAMEKEIADLKKGIK